MAEPLDLKKTINLPRTRFPMKANLPLMEPRILEQWEGMGLEHKIEESRQGRPAFVLHDGPPYANGHIHLGHALNKILKDMIVKSRTMAGFLSPYVPGWDCHGLPIEIKVLGEKKRDLEPLEVRRRCREYALRFVRIQKEEFKRLGVFGRWQDPYLTMSPAYEAEIARLFGHFVRAGSVYRGLKPVHWCIQCETALAEAEVEYADHSSPSVYVRFPLLRGGEILGELPDKPLFALIWTTTPWTLPANLAICFHPDYEYALLDVGESLYLVATLRIEEVAGECGFEDPRVIRTVPGRALSGLVFRHPWLERESVSLLGEHVTLEQGTGAVHTAPGHGQEDYQAGVEAGLEIYCPVGPSGTFAPEVEHFGGLGVFQANAAINRFMARQGVLVAERQITHSYPHCWRCHHPVIFRATPQWFISMDHEGLREKALSQIERVEWIPAWGRERIGNMIASRPDWCISRQRIWGVPIVAFYCRKCRQPLLDPDVIDHVAEIFSRESADAWYARSVKELLPRGTACGCGGREFSKEFDILDVWFDSGASHHAVLGHTTDLPWPAAVYLEGGDQYRGWFHSSLLLAVALRQAAPYQRVICHGWALDAEGRAMSKSRGNVISPLEVMKKNGAEILRLWVASIDYTEDARLGEEILARLRDAYRKIRNTQRFLLGNLYDFSPRQMVSDETLHDLDRWALARLAQVARQVEEAYQRFEFHGAYQALYHFCVVDLSSFYLDVLKDRLYVSAPDSPGRRAAQSTLFRISDTLVRLLAPILPFTCEEIWSCLYPEDPPLESVHMAEFSRSSDPYHDPELLEHWKRLLELRSRVSKALEESRSQGQIGHSLEALVRLRISSELASYLEGFKGFLESLFIVSRVEIELRHSGAREDLEVEVEVAPGQKCQRCWRHDCSVGEDPQFPTLCSRCREVLSTLGSAVGPRAS